jgi:putative transposase
VEHVCESLAVSERQACRALSLLRSTMRYLSIPADDQSALSEAIVDLATRYGRYGYRRITTLLRMEGWRVNHKRVERIWRREGLKVPQRQPKRSRLWLNDGSCVRLRPEYTNHVWSYDFMTERLRNGRLVRILNIIDEHSKESLAGLAKQRITSDDVLETLGELFLKNGIPEYIRSDNGLEFTAIRLRKWLKHLGVKTLFIEPGSPWENAYIESYNGKMRDELLDSEVFDSILEVQVLTDMWRDGYNRVRPHSSLGYRPPAPEAWMFNARSLIN